MQDVSNVSIEITHLNSMGVAVGISLISGAVHEICHLLHFPGPPSCFPGPGRRHRMLEVCQLSRATSPTLEYELELF